MPLEYTPLEGDIILPKPRAKSGSVKENSWSEIIKRVLAMPADEAREYFSGTIKNIPETSEKTLKELIIARVVGELILNPTPSLLNLIMEREEGKVAETVNMNQITKIEVNIRKIGGQDEQDDAFGSLEDPRGLVRQGTEDTTEET